MKIGIFAPFGSMSNESGLLYLLANYLQGYFVDKVHEVVALKCNGAFSLCDRDGERGWKRGVHSCLSCMRDQAGLALWSSIAIRDISPFITSDDVVATRRWMMTTPTHELMNTTYHGHPLADLCRGSLKNRFGVGEPDLNNRLHEQMVRRLMVASMRMLGATSRFATWFMPELMLVVGGDDVLSRSLLAQMRRLRRDCALLRWDIGLRSVAIHHPRTGQVLTCELMIEGLQDMRSDCRTWSNDLVSILDGILNFLDIPRTQLSLPMAR